MEDGQLSDSDSDMTVTPSDTPLQVLVSVKGGRAALDPARGARAAGAALAGAAGCASPGEEGPPGLAASWRRRAAVFFPPSTRRSAEGPTPAPLGCPGAQVLPNMQ